MPRLCFYHFKLQGGKKSLHTLDGRNPKQPPRM